MKIPLRFKFQEWLAKHSAQAQFPRQQFIPRSPIARAEPDLLSTICKLMVFGFAMFGIFGSFLAAAAFFIIGSIG